MSQATDAQKSLRKLQRRARRQGWTVERVSSGHIRWTAPDNASYITTSFSPRSLAGVKAAECELRKAGLR